jgi:hypothetical protein
MTTNADVVVAVVVAVKTSSSSPSSWRTRIIHIAVRRAYCGEEQPNSSCRFHRRSGGGSSSVTSKQRRRLCRNITTTTATAGSALGCHRSPLPITSGGGVRCTAGNSRRNNVDNDRCCGPHRCCFGVWKAVTIPGQQQQQQTPLLCPLLLYNLR